MFGLSRISNGIQWEGFLSRTQYRRLKESLNSTLAAIRPNAVALVDAFDIPDHILNSTLGASDGRVYDRLFEEAQRNPLNSGKPVKGYEYVEEYLNKDFLKLHNKPTEELARL